MIKLDHLAIQVADHKVVRDWYVSTLGLRDATYRRLSAAGVAFAHPPQSVYWGYGAELTDPAGKRVRLWDPKSMDEKPAAPSGRA